MLLGIEENWGISMNFIAVINKYSRDIKYTKTDLYRYCEEHKNVLETLGIRTKTKSEIDLFNLEILLRAIDSKNAIDGAYDLFNAANYDMFDYITYEEKRKMFNNDLEKVLVTLPHFCDKESLKDIYIPIYSPEINNWFISDYQILLLKQHAEYLKNQTITPTTAYQYYGPRIFDTDFSCLKKIYENESHVAYFYEELGTIYLFVKEDFSLICRIVVGDDARHSQKAVIEDAKELVELYEKGDYTQFVDYMHDHQLISDHTYKKINKKVK